MKKGLTEIIVVLDRSGSMASIAKDMEGGFNEFIRQQRLIPGECRVTLVQFDTQYEMVYAGMDLHSVPPLKLEPRGGTALLDAIGRTIEDTGRRYSSMQEAERPERVLFVVLSDGQENSSNPYGSYIRPGVVPSLIKRQTDVYSWQFVYFGANQDAIAVAHGLNIPMAENFSADTFGVACALNNMTTGSANYRAGHGYIVTPLKP